MTSQAQQTEQRAWQAMRDAEDRAARMWTDNSASSQARQAACWEAECARQQWSNAADHAIASRAA